MTHIPDLAQLRIQAVSALDELFRHRAPRRGETIVLGCSTSEVAGSPLGKASDLEIGRAIVEPMFAVCDKAGVCLAVQGCEHVNRVLVVAEELAELRDLVPVNLVPVNGAGGAAARVYHTMLGQRAVVVEDLGKGADYGLDIGGVLIGMHLRRDRVAVPVHIGVEIGKARVNGAYCRLKWVGGPRTHPADC